MALALVSVFTETGLQCQSAVAGGRQRVLLPTT